MEKSLEFVLMDEQATAMTENKLAIEVIFRSFGYKQRIYQKVFKRFPVCSPVQGEPFEYGVRVKNIGDSVFEGALAKNLMIRPAAQLNFYHPFSNEFLLSTLNPGQSIELFAGKTKTDLSGQAWFSFEIAPKQANTRVSTFQVGVDENYEKFAVSNAWGGSFVIGSRYEVAQERTNFLILTLTILTTIQGIWGLKIAILWLLGILRHFLTFLLKILNTLPT